MNKQNKRKVNKVLAILCFVGFMACLVWLLVYLVQTVRNGKAMEELKEQFAQETESEESKETDEAVEAEQMEEVPQEEEPDIWELYSVPQKEIDFAALQEENEDVYAWITIPDTGIDYPVLQHPKEMDYYLHHNIDGSKGYPGCIYTQFYNAKDWKDNNTVLYGHNMRDHTMFANLHYFEDSKFFETHPYVYLYSENQVRVYQVFAAYEFSNAHLLLSFNMEDKESYGAYLENIFQIEGMNNHYNNDLELTTEDKIITLSTCINSKPERRYLVQAVLIAEENQE